MDTLQDRSDRITYAAPFPQKRTDHSLLPTSMSSAGLESLMLSLRLRASLAGSEEAILDRISQENAGIFVVHGGVSFNAQGCEQLIMEPVDIALNSGSSAVFSHRRQVPDPSLNTFYRINTAVIDPEAAQLTVLGMIHAEDLRLDRRMNQFFGNLVIKFRQAAATIESLAADLRVILDDDVAVMVVNRASGRVVATNSLTGNLLRQEPGLLIDQEFSRLKPEITKLGMSCRMEMRNLCRSLLNVTVVSLRQKAAHSFRHHSPNDFFAHRMRNKITAITSASTLLDGVHNDTNHSEIPDLARIILTGANDIERDLSRWVSLIDYGFGKKQRTTIQEELDRAIRSTRFCTGHTHTIEVVTAETPITVVDAHKQSLMYMFEAALLSHLEPAKIASSTSIQCSRVYTPSQFTVCLQTGMTIEGKQTGPDSGWQEFATQLAQAMGGDLSFRRTHAEKKLETTITIPC